MIAPAPSADDTQPLRPLQVAPARYVRLGPVAELATGLTQKAMELKIERGEWKEDEQWIFKDGRRYIDLRGYETWVESGKGRKK